MAAPSSTIGRRKPPPRRGQPYYDVARGQTMILPPKGGGAVPHVRDAPRQPFSAKQALRQAGIRAGSAADRGALRVGRAIPTSSRDVATLTGGTGWGPLVFYVFLSILGLALLHNALGGRGPAAVQKLLGFLGGSINRLVSPTDPLIRQGTIPGSSSTSTTAAPTTGAAGYVSPFAGLTGVKRGRIDQGVDFEAGAGNVGKPIRAIGAGTVVSITSDPTGFGKYIAYQLEAGPQKGQVVYVGHSEPNSALRVGSHLGAGDTVAAIAGLGPGAAPGHIELGFADPKAPNRPLAQTNPRLNAGRLFSLFMQALGL